MSRVPKADIMRRLLCQQDYTISELADEARCNYTHAMRWIKRWELQGKVRQVGKRINQSHRESPSYIWCDDDDMAALAARAADYITEGIGNGREIARRIYEKLNEGMLT